LSFSPWKLLLIACLLACCAREPADPGEREDRLVVLLESAPRDIDPRLVSDASSTKVSRLVFCALTTLETPDLRPRLEAAESIRPACSGREEFCTHYIVALKDGIYWGDGTQVSAADVVFTYRSMIESSLPSPFRGDLQRKIRRVWEEDGEVHFELARPFATFAADLSIGLVPAHMLEPRGGLEARFDEDYVGCGPFRYDYRYRDQKIVLSRNDYYWNPVGPKHVVVRILPDEATRVLSMMAGSGDVVVNGLSPPLVRKLEEMPEVKVLHAPAACTTYLSFNLLDEHLADLRVRKAIAMGIDREGLVANQLGGMAQVAKGVLPPMHWAYSGEVEEHPYNPAGARELLSAARLTENHGEGTRLHLTLKVTTDRFRRNIGSLIAWQLSEIGIDVELLPLELSTFLGDVRKGNYQMYILQVPEVVDPDIYRWLMHSQAAPVLAPVEEGGMFGAVDRTLFPPGYATVSGPLGHECRARWIPFVIQEALENVSRRALGLPTGLGNGNRSFFFDPYLDCCLDLGYTTMDEASRLDFYREAQRVSASMLPILPLWHEDNVAVVSSRVEDWRLRPINRFSSASEVSTGR